MPETCVLWWTTNLTSDTTFWVPTNFPTRHLEIRAERTGLTNVIICVNGGYDYGREVEIDVCFISDQNGHGIVRLYGSGGGYLSMGNVSGNNSRYYTFSFDPASKAMRAMGVSSAIAAPNLSTATFCGGLPNAKPTGPCTVEEWIALWEAQHATD